MGRVSGEESLKKDWRRGLCSKNKKQEGSVKGGVSLIPKYVMLEKY